MTQTAFVRASVDSDIQAITDLYAHHVLKGTATFEVQAPSVTEMIARRSDVLSKKLPYLVLEDQQEIIGFAYCNWFRPRFAFRFAAEDSIYLSPKAQGQGFGRLLLSELCVQAENAGMRRLIAMIGDSENHASIGVHKSLGFESTGVLRSVGWKFNRWLDVVIMEKTLGLGDSQSPI